MSVCVCVCGGGIQDPNFNVSAIQYSESVHWTRIKDIALLYGAFDKSGLLWRLLDGLLVRADGTGGGGREAPNGRG